MRKMLFVALVLALIILSGCGNINEYEGYPQDSEPADTPQATEPEEKKPLEEFSFRGHKFWDTLEQVIEKEGEPDRDKTYDEDYAYTIFYDDVEIFGYTTELSFSFFKETLHDISVEINNFDKHLTIKEHYDNLKINLVAIDGEPDSETFGDYIIGLWINVDLDYAMTLYSSEERLSFGMRGEPKFSDELTSE